MPPPPLPVRDRDPDGDPRPDLRPSCAESKSTHMDTRDPRIDPQAGDEVRGVDGQLGSVIRRGDALLGCQDGAKRYRTTLQSWQEWCVQTGTATEPVSERYEGTEH